MRNDEALKKTDKGKYAAIFSEMGEVLDQVFCKGESTSSVTISPLQNNLIWIFAEPNARTFIHTSYIQF